jgi:hypothetical protein
MHHGHHHEHVHTENTATDSGTVLKQEPNGHDDSKGALKAVDLSALDRHMYSGKKPWVVFCCTSSFLPIIL